MKACKSHEYQIKIVILLTQVKETIEAFWEIFIIDDRNRKAFYSLLMSLYRKEKAFVRKSRNEGIKKSAAQGNYRGRKQKEINDLEFHKISAEYLENTITSQVAADSLGISRSTFFRKLNQWRSK